VASQATLPENVQTEEGQAATVVVVVVAVANVTIVENLDILLVSVQRREEEDIKDPSGLPVEWCRRMM